MFLKFLWWWIAAAFKSREDHQKQIQLEEARKSGLAPAELDEDGKEINPHIHRFISSPPWYLKATRPVSFSLPSLLFYQFFRYTLNCHT